MKRADSRKPVSFHARKFRVKEEQKYQHATIACTKNPIDSVALNPKAILSMG
jgi:hypothetical protein